MDLPESVRPVAASWLFGQKTLAEEPGRRDQVRHIPGDPSANSRPQDDNFLRASKS